MISLNQRPGGAMAEVYESPFIAFLGALMAERGISKNQIASYADVSPSTVGNWMRGSLPQPDSLRKLARALGMPYRHLRDLAYPVDEDGEPSFDMPDADLIAYLSIPKAQRPGMIRLWRQAFATVNGVNRAARPHADEVVEDFSDGSGGGTPLRDDR